MTLNFFDIGGPKMAEARKATLNLQTGDFTLSYALF
jgi:hypothetical protein